MNHKGVSAVVFAAVLVVASVVVIAIGNADEERPQFVIASPEPGFKWSFDDDLVIHHVGSGTLPNTTGQLHDVQIVNLEQDDISDTLYLTDDFRFVVFRNTPMGGAAEGLHSFTWTGEETPWLYGASEWFGAQVEIRGDEPRIRWEGASEYQPLEGIEVDMTDNRVSVAYMDNPEVPFVPGYASPGDFVYRGEFAFEAESPAPVLLVTPQESKSYSGREYDLVSVSETQPTETRTGREINDLPTPVNSTGMVPLHTAKWDHPFPFEEAWEQIKDDVPTDFILTNIYGWNSRPSSQIWLGAGLEDRKTYLEKTWSWDITVDTLTEPPLTYRVSKHERNSSLMDDPDYNVEIINKSVPDVREVAIEEKVFYVDQLIRLVENLVDAQYLHVTVTPIVYDGVLVGQTYGVSLEPRDPEEPSGTGIQSEVFILEHIDFDTQTGNLAQGHLAKNLLERMLFESP